MMARLKYQTRIAWASGEATPWRDEPLTLDQIKKDARELNLWGDFQVRAMGFNNIRYPGLVHVHMGRERQA